MLTQSAQVHGSIMSQVPSEAPPVQVGWSSRHAGLNSQSAQPQPSVKGIHSPSLLQFIGSAQKESASQSGHTQFSLEAHMPSSTQPVEHALRIWQSMQRQFSPASHVPFGTPAPHCASIVHFGSIVQSAQSQSSMASQVPSATAPVQVGSVLHCGVSVQSAQVHGSIMSHMPSTVPFVQVGWLSRHSGFVAQSGQPQPSL